MGYRSDVRIVVSPKGYEKLKEHYEMLIAQCEGVSSLLDDATTYREDEKNVVFGWDDIKWYDFSYDDVSCMMKTLDYLEENDFGYRFARIGEELGDIDRRENDGNEDSENYNSLDDLYISTSFDDFA